MARARNIKPGFFRNADLVDLPVETRLLFIGLWTLADRDGRLEDRPKQIKMEIFPADSIDCNAALDELAATGMLKRYEVGGKRYLQVVNFTKHQNPHRDEKASTIPDEYGHVAESSTAQPKHRANTVQAPCKPDAETVAIGLNPDPRILNPESRILKPDSLTEEKGEPRKRDPRPAVARPDDVDEQTWTDWLALRKAKRAPVTQTTVDGAREQSAMAGMPLVDFLRVWCRRGSQGLEAAWLKPEERGQPTRQPLSFAQQDEIDRRKRYEEMTGRKWPTSDASDVIEINPTRLSA